MTFSGQEDRVGILKKLEEDFMKTMNMKKTVLAGVMAGAALYAFSFTAVPAFLWRFLQQMFRKK